MILLYKECAKSLSLGIDSSCQEGRNQSEMIVHKTGGGPELFQSVAVTQIIAWNVLAGFTSLLTSRHILFLGIVIVIWEVPITAFSPFDVILLSCLPMLVTFASWGKLMMSLKLMVAMVEKLILHSLSKLKGSKTLELSDAHMMVTASLKGLHQHRKLGRSEQWEVCGTNC